MINLEKHLKRKGIRVNYTQSTNVFPRINLQVIKLPWTIFKINLTYKQPSRGVLI